MNHDDRPRRARPLFPLFALGLLLLASCASPRGPAAQSGGPAALPTRTERTPHAPASARRAAGGAADSTWDAPATRLLVERTIARSRTVPPGLEDYRVAVRSRLETVFPPDTAAGGDMTAALDVLVSDVRWSRDGALHQTITGHRTQGSRSVVPWVIPHLYGAELAGPVAGWKAVNPFGPRGPEFYRYTADHPIELRFDGEVLKLIPLRVTPRRRQRGDSAVVLVLGTFLVDDARAAVAQARYAFVRGGGTARALGRLDAYVELENGLWDGRFWLPFRQRREILLDSPLLGGGVAARLVSHFSDYELNTGWSVERSGAQLSRQLAADAFTGWEDALREDAARLSTEDFADLRSAAAGTAGQGGSRPALHYERGVHLLRYNRVEGLYLGAGARVVSPSPLPARWELYGTAGWAFAEATARGELTARVRAAGPSPQSGSDWGASATAYRRLHEIQAFRPTLGWDLVATLPAVLQGSDPRDYHDARGGEAFLAARQGRTSVRVGARLERHDSVQVNTTRYLRGTAPGFGPLARITPGRHAALEAGAGYTLGSGAFGMGNSVVARADVEHGLADFQFTRVTAGVGLRHSAGRLTFAFRADAGHATGDVPPQKLFRFGSVEGLRSHEPGEFGGSSAVLTRGRLLLGLPPRGTEPLGRSGRFIIPPLRPSLVVLGESGWTWIDERRTADLTGIRASATDGARAALGLGISFLDDALTVERLQPVGRNAGERAGRWHAGLTYWY